VSLSLAEITLLAIAAGLLLEVWRSHRSLRRSMDAGPVPPRLKDYPSVTVIRPIRGVDAGLDVNLREALDNGYPGSVDTLFVVDDEDEAALPAIRAAIAQAKAARPTEAKVIIAGEPPAHRTGKLNAMIVGLRHARGEVVVFADSDTRSTKDTLRVLVETLMSNENAGSAFAPVLVSEPPRTVGDAGYALLLNGLYGPAAAAAARRRQGSLPFIMGQFMPLRREAIEAIDGLECAEGQLVDDMYLGAQVHRTGLRNMLAPRQVDIVQYGLPLGDFFKVYLRWLTFSRSGLPGRDFKLSSWLRGAVFWLGLVVAAVGVALASPLVGLAGLTVPLAMTASINALHHGLGSAQLGGRYWLVAFGLLLTGPVVMLVSLFRRQVGWRGRSYTLDGTARLQTKTSHEPSAPAADAPMTLAAAKPAAATASQAEG